MSEITVLGLGNPLLRDDGVGPKVIEELNQRCLPEGVTATTAGGPFYLYQDIFARSNHIIVVDAMQGGGPTGSLYLMKPGDIKGETESITAKHEDDFLTVVEIMKYFGFAPEVTIIGIEPGDISPGLGLTPELARRLPDINKKIRAVIDRVISE
ncbi:MAG: hydrogenase maturation protease [Bacillota bacterium]